MNGSSTSAAATFGTLPTGATSITAKVFTAASGGTQVGSTITNYTSGTALTGLSANTTYYIELTAIGGTDYNDTTFTRVSVTSNLAAQVKPTVTSTSGTYGNALTLLSGGGSGNGAVTYSTNTAGCSIAGTGPYTISSTSAQTCVVTATKAAEGNYPSKQQMDFLQLSFSVHAQ